jgi:hypothetical protein
MSSGMCAEGKQWPEDRIRNPGDAESVGTHYYCGMQSHVSTSVTASHSHLFVEAFASPSFCC